MKRNAPPRRALVGVLALTCGFLLAPAAMLVAQPPQQLARLDDLPGLAESGQFDRVLNTLRSQPNAAAEPSVASLLRDLEHYQQSRRKHLDDRRQAFNEAHEKMVEKTGAGQLVEALHAAVDAHSLTDDRDGLLRDPAVTELVRLTVAEARAAEAGQDWIEALSLYRALDLLYDDHSTYRGDAKRAGRHVRVLRMYAPQQLEILLKAQAKRQGREDNDEPNPLQGGEDDTWQQRLRDIELAMYRQTLAQAARRHVNDSGYLPLMRGSIASLITLLSTQGLEGTFPGFRDQARLVEFRGFLQQTLRELDQPGKQLNFLDAATLIDKITVMNDRTLKLPESVLVYEMTEGATDTLDDFSAVIWPQEKDNFSRNTQGKFFGVGIQISRRDGRLLVVSPLEGTPAQRAGVKAGDIIAQVDGRDTASWTLDQAVREITGPEGTLVTLGIERPGEVGIKQVPIRRAEIVIESIKGWEHKPGGGWNYFIDPDNRIAYIRLSQFIPQTADDLDAAINQMQRDGGLRGLILDLRFNPGGLLSSAIDVADRFIASGPIVSTVDAAGLRTSEARAKRHRTQDSFPVVVLINQGSASASEIVAGALQDYGRGLIVGVRSFGKGSVQDLFPIDGGKAYLKLTTQYYRLPQGRIIHRKPDADVWGVEPDLVVPMTDQQVAAAIEFRQDVDILRDAPADADKPAPRAGDILAQSLDPQLEAALLVLKTRVVTQQIAVAQR